MKRHWQQGRIAGNRFQEVDWNCIENIWKDSECQQWCTWPKGAYAFFPEYIQEKTHTPFLAKCIIVDVLPLSYAFHAIPVYLLKSVSCNSAPLSSALGSLTSIYFWTIAVIYNSAGLWMTVPLSSFLQLSLLWAGRNTAGLLQAVVWFRHGTLSIWLIPLPGGKWELNLPVQTPPASLSLVLPIPVHFPQKLQTGLNRRLMALTFQVGRVLVKHLECCTRVPGDENWDIFEPVSRYMVYHTLGYTCMF